MTVHSIKSELYVPERGVEDAVLDIDGIKENDDLPHCRGAVALYAIDNFSYYRIPNLLIGKQGKLFGCFK